jgi:hypothetical protein
LEDRRHFFEGGDESDMDNGVSDGDNERNVPKSQHCGSMCTIFIGATPSAIITTSKMSK